MARTIDNHNEQRRGFFRGLALITGGAVLGAITTAKAVSGSTAPYVTPTSPQPATKPATGARVARYNTAPKTVPSVRLG